MAVVPGYKYLGPGNKLNKGDPVNETDLIAQIHDLEYSTAISDNDIRKADLAAIKNFHNSKDGYIGSTLGEVGIGIKYGVESLTGVLYGGGNMPGDPHSRQHLGRQLYTARQSAIHQGFREAVDAGLVQTLSDFRNSDKYKQILADHRKGGKVYQELEQNRLSNAIALDPNTSNDGEPSTSRPRTSTPTFEDDDFDWTQFLDSFESNIADETVASLPEEQPMDPQQSGSGRGPNTGARGSVSSAVTTSAATTVQGNNSSAWLKRTSSSCGGSLNYSKSRIFYSYAYATQTINGNQNTYDCVTTPMALIPVDFLPFYLTPAEFSALPEGAFISKVWCKVSPIGTRTAFDTGTTLSGSATSEYIPIGMTAIGLNVDFYGVNQKYDTDATNPMKPTSLRNIQPSDMIKKYYTDTAGHSMCVPRSISEYFTHHWNKSSNPDPKKYPDYQTHNAGVAHFDQKCDQFLINSLINQSIINYTYTPKCGIINKQKEHFIPYNRRKNDVETEFYRARSHQLQFFESGSHAPVQGDIGFSSIERAAPVLINSLESSYIRQIENYGSFNLQDGNTSFHAQPQVHVGIQAVPQLNPANENSNFLNSCCYWKVDCGCTINFNLGSAFTKGPTISWPKEVRFVENTTHKYTDGRTLFGNTDARTGVVSGLEEELDEYDIIESTRGHKKIRK